MSEPGDGDEQPPQPHLQKMFCIPDIMAFFRHIHAIYVRYRQTRFSSRRVRRRVVFKHGDCNVVQGKVAKRRRRYLQDIFTTLVDAQWRWTLLVFACSFMLSWTMFALVWWFIFIIHGDFGSTSTTTSPFNSTATATVTTTDGASMGNCVQGVNSFTTAFLFSVETQHTIGYGARYTKDDCPTAILFMCLQSITGVMIQAFMVGVVFAKLSRPKKRTQTLLFSRHAVICQRDGELCLMFRVGDMRKSHIIEAHVRAQLIKMELGWSEFISSSILRNRRRGNHRNHIRKRAR